MATRKNPSRQAKRPRLDVNSDNFSGLKQQIALAAKEGNVEECKRIILNKCDPENGEREALINAADKYGRTVLHRAAEKNRADVISWVLSPEGGRAFGFTNLFAQTTYGISVLHACAQDGLLTTFQAILDGCTDGERQELLNAVGANDWTVLHHAAKNHNLPVINWLLSNEGGRAAGFNKVLAKNVQGETAFHLAAISGLLETCKAIANGCREEDEEREQMLNAVNNFGETVLCGAVTNCQLVVVTWLLSSKAGGGRDLGFDSVLVKTSGKSHSVLHRASIDQFSAGISVLLADCTSTEVTSLFLAVDNLGWTPLHHAAQLKNATSIAILMSYPECAQIINRKDNRGMTALHRAIIGGIDKESLEEWDPSGARVYLMHSDYVARLLGTTSEGRREITPAQPAEETLECIDPNVRCGY